jgi:signal transduction histidine kinase/CheY-like chemotaxis protein
MLIFIGLSVRQYYILNVQQRKETAEFVNKQIILCGKSIEDASIDFEESVKFEFADHELRYFFDLKTEQLDPLIRSSYVDSEIKRIRRFYSRNQVLISKITIYNDTLFRSFERKGDNYFTVLRPQAFPSRVKLLNQTKLTDSAGRLTYTQPIRNSEGNLVANIDFDINISNFISSHFDKFYLGKNSWDWAIDTTGQVLFQKYSEQVSKSTFMTDVIELFRSKLRENLSASLQHTIHTDKDINVYSVFYPVNILGKKTGIVFSVDTDSLWKKQNESNILIFVYFLVVILSIILLFSIVIRQMLAAKKHLETTDALLRTANQASEVLLTDPDFSSSMYNFLKITAKALGYQRAYLMEITEKKDKPVYRLRHEWYDETLVKPFATAVPEIIDGLETRLFQNTTTSSLHSKPAKYNENDFEQAYIPILNRMNCKAYIHLSVYTEENIFGTIGFADCVNPRQWNEFEDAIFANFANAVGGALSAQKKKEELITAKNMAESANIAKSEFLANVSHEIRTPMNSILGFSEVMLNTTENQKQKSYLKTILNSAKSLLILINDILDLSKIEAGRLEISPEPTNLRFMIREMEQLFQHKTQEKGIDFSIEIDERLPQSIVIDEVRLRQILLNLVGNAVKFTQTGFVKISVRLLSKKNGIIHFEIAVVDSGIGIPQEDHQRIFESFSQQSGENSKKYGGTGLGLSITRRLLELMNGNIKLISKPGKGSSFTITFTNIKYSDYLAEKESRFLWNDAIINFKGSKILVVDDIPFNRNLVLAYLENYDLMLFEADSGESAVQMATENIPDLIFMDLRMPAMDGYIATQIIKSNPLLANVPIVALTASIMHSEIAKAKNIFSGFLHKPVQKKSLINEMIKHLPFEKTEVQSAQDHDLAASVTFTGNVEISAEIKSIFQHELAFEVTSQIDIMNIDNLIELAEKLDLFATQHKLSQLKTKCGSLVDYIEAFDFEKIQKYLIEINDLFKS